MRPAARHRGSWASPAFPASKQARCPCGTRCLTTDNRPMTQKILFGFHAVTVRLKTAPESVVEVHVDTTRRDARMRQFVERAGEAGVRVVDSDDERLSKLVGAGRHQGVVAHVKPLAPRHSLDDVLDDAQGPALVLVLDGVTDPHN